MNYYRSLAVYKAEVDRLTTFGEALEKARMLGKTAPRIEHEQASNGNIHLRGLHLTLPNGREIVRADDLTLPQGKTLLVTGPSGSGKSTLFRAIAGIWPYGHGIIEFPHRQDGTEVRVMLLPQRPYVANGTLKRSASYPATEHDYSDDDVQSALRKAHLEQFIDRLHDDDVWGQRLSGGEQQRLSIAHALLAKPDWLFLDEATSALDEKLEKSIYQMLKRELPNTTIVSIGHRSTLIDLHDARLEMVPDDQGIHLPVQQVEKTAP